MNLLRIAARVAGVPSLQLQGPFPVSNPEYDTEIDLPFGIVGAFAPILAKEFGVDVNEIEAGPISDVPIGYNIEETYSGGRKSYNWYQPDDPEEYELIVTVTHIGNYQLSPTDAALINRKTDIPEQISKKMEEYHLERARQEHEDRFDDPDFD